MASQQIPGIWDLVIADHPNYQKMAIRFTTCSQDIALFAKHDGDPRITQQYLLPADQFPLCEFRDVLAVFNVPGIEDMPDFGGDVNAELAACGAAIHANFVDIVSKIALIEPKEEL